MHIWTFWTSVELPTLTGLKLKLEQETRSRTEAYRIHSHLKNFRERKQLSSLCILLCVVCGGVFTQEGTTIRSPYYPDPYPRNRECKYLIMAPEGSSITLTFTTFDIEKSNDELCRYDNLEVRPLTVLWLISTNGFGFGFVFGLGLQKPFSSVYYTEVFLLHGLGLELRDSDPFPEWLLHPF